MKAQFCLMLLLNGLLVCANSLSAAAATATPDLQVAHLSKTIANLIDFDDRNLVAQAINRALLAQNSRADDSLPQLAGDVQQVTPKPIINGKVANPNPNPDRDPKNGEGRPRRRPTNTPPVASPNDPPVLINGIILRK